MLSEANWQAVSLSLQLASLTIVILLLVSTPLAWVLARMRSRWKTLLESLTALPLVLPPTVLGFYLLMSMGPQGALGSAWQSVFGQPLAFSFSGLLIASCIYSLPFVVQPLQASFEQMDKRMIEAAKTLGDRGWRIFYAVILPQCKRGFVTAIVLGFAHTIGEFGVVLMVGGNIPGMTQVVSISIYEEVEVMNYQAAHVLSAFLLIFSFAILYLVYSLNRHWSRPMLSA